MNRLHIDSLLSIGAVEAGDNPESDILFWKRKNQEPEPGPVEKEGTMPNFDIASLDPEVQAYISDLETKAHSMVEEPAAPLPDDLPDVVTKRLDLQDAEIAKAKAENDELAKKLAAAEETRATEKWEGRAAELAPLFDPETMAPVLKTLASAEPEATGKLDDMFTGLMAKTSLENVLKEFGDATAEGSALDQIAKHAAEMRKADPNLSPVDARAQAWRDHPELKTQSREEGN